MDAIGKLVENIKRTGDGARQAQIRFVECVSVDWENKTMEAIGTGDGIEYLDVILGFGYTDIKPAIGTLCLIGIIDGQEVVTFLINAEQAELVETKAGKIVYNGGENAGLIKIGKLIEQVNQIETTLNSFLGEYTSHTHLCSTGSSGTPIPPPQTKSIELTEISDIENVNIKH